MEFSGILSKGDIHEVPAVLSGADPGRSLRSAEPMGTSGRCLQSLQRGPGSGGFLGAC